MGYGPCLAGLHFLSPLPLAGEGEGGKRRETGMRKKVSKMNKHQIIKQVLPQEESAPGKPSPCALRGDPRGEA
jgi:hypothetical protein